MRDEAFIQQRVDAIPGSKLGSWNQKINDRLANEIGMTAINLAPTSLSSHIDAFKASLGDGSRKIEGLSTGIDEVDHLIGGLNKFVLMAARAGTGKSTLAVQLALGVAATEHRSVLYYSYEMSRGDVMTMMLQNLQKEQATNSSRLFRSDIVLNGNNPGLPAAKRGSLAAGIAAIEEIGRQFYVIDTSDMGPDLARIEADLAALDCAAGNEPLVVIDSIQDLVKPDSGGATAAEAFVAQRICEIQQATGATFLAISQKAKGGNLDDPYAGVMGSVAMLHKPTSVIELRGAHDLIRNVKDKHMASIYRKLADSSVVPRPVVISVLKGRNNGYGNVCLAHYGAYSYFTVGRIPDYDNGDTSLYDLNSL